MEALCNGPCPTGHFCGEGSGSKPKKYQAELFYGYHGCECGIFHAFELTDPDVSTDRRELAKKLADLLDTKPENDDFNYNSMYVALPEPLVERIKAEAVKEFLENHRSMIAGGKPAGTDA